MCLDMCGVVEKAILGLQKMCTDWGCIGFDFYTNLCIEFPEKTNLCQLVPPNYFTHYLSPLVSVEVPIRFASQRVDGLLTRGDCDQDRPSLGSATFRSLDDQGSDAPFVKHEREAENFGSMPLQALKMLWT